MIEQPRKIHFESLPFSPKLVYFKVKEASIPESSSDSNESNEEEYDRNNDAIEFLNENDFGGDLSLDNPKPNHPKRKKKTFVNLNEKEQNFQFSFYQIFTTRKKFPKKFVSLIHNEICINLNLRRINRDETRSISLYFHNFAKHSEKILLFISVSFF